MKVLIVGAGMSGLCMGIKLKRAGVPFTILEKSPHLGGTWWENTYPGCACDIPSHLYAFSFAPKADWSRKFPPQAEILSYLRGLAEDHGLLEHIRFDTVVREARYQEEDARWRSELGSGETLEAEAFVSAVGPLHVPKYPAIEGLGSFAGPSFHSARWDHKTDLAGLRVGVIGNAASAVQLVPEVAKEAKELHVFQRSAHWVLPRLDCAYPRFVQWLLRLTPLQRAYRVLLYVYQELGFFLLFRKGALAARAIQRQIRKQIQKDVSDPATQEALVPDYPFGCKRALLSNDYYPTLNRANVHVVTDPLVREQPEGLATEATTYALDAVIYATGFDALTLAPLKIYGRDNEELGATWERSPQAHLGITVPKFPNFYVLLGPNTGLGHNSVMWMVECQSRYVVRCLAAQKRAGLRALEVREEVLEAFYTRIDRRMKNRVWSECKSWYRRDDGLIFALWPSSTLRYWWETRRPRLADFHEERRG